MSGGGGSKSSSTTAQPKWLREYARDYLLPMFQNQLNPSQESPYYGQLSNMYQGILGQGTQLNPDVSNTLQQMVQTGNPFDQTKIYQSALPQYQSNLTQGIAQARETGGMEGGLRSSGADTYMGRAIGQTTEDFQKYLTEMGMQGHEAAAGRQMGAIPLGMQGQQFPMQMLSQLGGLGQQTQMEQYPWLQEAMKFFQGSPMISTGSSATAGGGSAGLNCCFIFIEGEGKLTHIVREFRDEHYLDTLVAKGYKKMASWLVPLMQRSKKLKFIIRASMTKPLTHYAEWYYGLNKWGWIGYPNKLLWTNIWRGYGRLA
jgi:hypothetical protein